MELSHTVSPLSNSQTPFLIHRGYDHVPSQTPDMNSPDILTLLSEHVSPSIFLCSLNEVWVQMREDLFF